MSESPRAVSEYEGLRLCDLDPPTLEVITSYLPLASILHLICAGSKTLLRRLTLEGGVKSIDYGDGLKSFAGTSTAADLHYLKPVTLPRPHFKLQNYRKSQFQHVSHLVLTQSHKAQSIALNDLPSSIRSLIYDLAQWPKVGGPHGEWHEALPNLTSLAISFGKQSTSTAPELKTLLAQLPSELKTLKVAYPGLFTTSYIEHLPPALTSFDFLRLNPTAANPPIPQYLPLLSAEFAVDLPSTITDLRIPTYILTKTEHGWGFKNLPSLRRLHLSQVLRPARPLLPTTITHLELIGELGNDEAEDIASDWPPELSTLSIAHHVRFEFPDTGNRLDVGLPSSITRLNYFESPHVRKGPRALFASNQLRHAFGDLKNSPEPYLAASLTCIELPTNFIAESQLDVVAKCHWLRQVSVYDVTLCGTSIPADATDISSSEQVHGWFWRYWGAKIPLVLTTATPLVYWTTAYESMTKEVRGRKHVPLPNSLRTLTIRAHGFNYNQLPDSIEVAQEIFVLGEFKKSLPHLVKLSLIWKTSIVVELSDILEMAPKLTELDGAWLSIPSSFIADNIAYFEASSIKTPQREKVPLPTSKPSKKSLGDYSMQHVQAAGALESEYGGPQPTRGNPSPNEATSSSAPASSATASSSAPSSDAPSQAFSALAPSNTLRIPEDFAASFVALTRPLKLANVHLGHDDLLRDLTVPLPVFERLVFSPGKFAVSPQFCKVGIPDGVIDVDAGQTHFLGYEGHIDVLPRLPPTLRRLSFTGDVASAFLFAPASAYNEQWLPASIEVIHINDVVFKQRQERWLLSHLPASLTLLSVSSTHHPPLEADLKALPSRLSARTWSDDRSVFTASVKEGSSKSDKCSIS